jgi:hypothetical protein
MNNIINQTMTISSPGLLSHMEDAKLSCFIGYTVATQTISTRTQKKQVQSRETVIHSLERSLKENADVWAELSKH